MVTVINDNVNTNDTIKFDPDDINGMDFLMKKYGDSNSLFEGTNESGEKTFITIAPHSIAVRTYQKNDWIRVNIYYDDGNIEEIYER